MNKNRDIILLTKVHIIKAMVFPVVMYGCESWTRKKAEPKNWCIQIVVLEKTLESPLDSKESKPANNLCFWTMVLEKTLKSSFDSKEFKLVNPKGNQSWIFIGCWSWNSCILATWSKNWLIGNTLMLGKIEDRRKRWWQRMMVECHDQLDGHEFEHVPGVGDGQGSLACFSP